MLAYYAVLSREALLIWRDRAGLCLLLLVPAVVISIGGFALRALFEGPPATIPLIIDDRDGSAAALALTTRLAEVPILEIVETGAGRDTGNVPVLIVPNGFTGAYERGEVVELTLELEPSARGDGDVIRAVLSEARARLAAGQTAARLASAQILAHTGDLDLADLRRDSLAAATYASWDEIRLIERFRSTGARPLRSFDLQVPGMATMFLLFGALGGVGRRILEDGETSRLRRMLMTPAPSSVILAAILSARAIVGVAQMLVLLAFGHVAFALPLGESPLALAVVVAAVVLAAVGCGLLLGSAAKTDEQLTMLGVAVILAMAALGGCWWPLFIEPEWMQTLANLTITKWAMQALTAVLLSGAGLRDVAVPALVLTAFGAGSLAIGMALYRRRWGWR